MNVSFTWNVFYILLQLDEKHIGNGEKPNLLQGLCVERKFVFVGDK